MTAVEITRAGEPSVLVPTQRPVPQPGPHDVLIKVAAAGVNRPDVLQRRGGYPPPPGITDIPGLEVAGLVVATGAQVQRWSPGDHVCALVAGGGYAEYCLAPEVQCLPVMPTLSLIEAAALPETAFTVWTNLFERGWGADGDLVLVHGGSSGIGTMAIRIAKAFGLIVYVTAGTDEKCRFCLELGADAAINYRTQDFVAEVKRLTGGRGVDIVLDMVGGDYVPRNLSCLTEAGRHVSIAVQRGATAEINLFDMMRRRLILTGSTLRNREVEVKGAIAASLEELVWPLVADGSVRPVIDSTYPLAQAAAAHARMESSAHKGKIVLTIGA
jgi:putative PIG3 family NAD(P)H quinone oxidoreductase